MFSGAVRTDILQLSHEIVALFKELDEFKGALRALGTLASERVSTLRRIATIESIGWSPAS